MPGTATATACALDTEFPLVSASPGDRPDVILQPDVENHPQLSEKRRNEGERAVAHLSDAACVAFTV
jgi:hypothetical protein